MPVDAVQRCHRLDRPPPECATFLLAELGKPLRLIKARIIRWHQSINAFHHEEWRTKQRWVGIEAEDRWGRDIGFVGERRVDATGYLDIGIQIQMVMCSDPYNEAALGVGDDQQRLVGNARATRCSNIGDPNPIGARHMCAQPVLQRRGHLRHIPSLTHYRNAVRYFFRGQGVQFHAKGTRSTPSKVPGTIFESCPSAILKGGIASNISSIAIASSRRARCAPRQ